MKVGNTSFSSNNKIRRSLVEVECESDESVLLPHKQAEPRENRELKTSVHGNVGKEEGERYQEPVELRTEEFNGIRRTAEVSRTVTSCPIF